jgi:L-iditol 2-dehydrogenase
MYMDIEPEWDDNGYGYPYIFETAGNPATIQIAYELTANKAYVGHFGTSGPMPLPTASIGKSQSDGVLFVSRWMGYWAPFMVIEWELTAHD